MRERRRSGLEIVSRLVTVDLGNDEDGDMMTSCVVEPVGEPAQKKAEPKKGGLTNAAKSPFARCTWPLATWRGSARPPTSRRCESHHHQAVARLRLQDRD